MKRLPLAEKGPLLSPGSTALLGGAPQQAPTRRSSAKASKREDAKPSTPPEVRKFTLYLSAGAERLLREEGLRRKDRGARAAEVTLSALVENAITKTYGHVMP